jgi:hypothetical protein
MRTAVDESVIGLAEIAGGLALLSGWFVPLGLAVLVPVTAGIVAFAIKTRGEEVTVGFVLAAAHLFRRGNIATGQALSSSSCRERRVRTPMGADTWKPRRWRSSSDSPAQ